MAKPVKRTTRKEKESVISRRSLVEFLPEKHHIWAVILILIILFLVFLSPMFFGGKSFESGDIIASQSARPYIEKNHDGFSLWNPYIFTGMPAYLIGTEPTWFNFIYMGFTFVRNIFAAPFAVDYVKWVFYLILLGMSSFLLIKHLTKNSLVSLFGALASVFSTGIIVFLFIGHVTKLTALCMYPLVFLLLLRMKDKIRLIDILLMIIVLQILIQGFHVQIIYYTVMAVGIYFIYYISRALIKKDTKSAFALFLSGVVLFGSLAIAALIQSDNLTQVYEYAPYSTRGTAGILEQQKEGTGQSQSDYYDYHTGWSFSPGEVLTFIVPSLYGFGNSTYEGELTNYQPVDVNTYFGQMPFVDVAMYMGVLVFFLALFAVFTMWKEPYVRFLTILSAFALLVSFGRTFPLVFDLLFKYLPYFDKFRVPSMILVLVQLSFPVLASFGLLKLVKMKTERTAGELKFLNYTLYVSAGIFILSILLNSSLKEWFSTRMTEGLQAKGQNAQQLGALTSYAADMFFTDILFAFGLTTLLFIAASAYIKGRIASDTLVIAAIILLLVDLWRIDARGAKYVDNPKKSDFFKQPAYITAIKSQNDKEPFRMLNLKQDHTPGSFNNNSNFNAYFLVEDFYGYSGVKPRPFQDMMDVIGPVNTTLWRMLNVKYIVTDQMIQFPGLSLVSGSAKSFVFRNDNVLPRLYLVDSVVRKSGIDILNAIKTSSFDPAVTAFTEEKIEGIQPSDSASYAKILDYKEAKITADVNATGKNFLFFGTTYQPKGWNAYVDGNKTEIYRADHGYMGIIVPDGRHKVEFIYAPASFFIAKYISMILSALVLAGLVLVVVFKKY